MPAISVTYSFSNGATSDASQVNQNFTDIINGTSDGTKDFSINALTVAGALSANGNVTIGNSSADDLTVTGSLASSIPIKTTRTYDIGSADLGLRILYLGGNSTYTIALQAPSASMAADYSLSLPTNAPTIGYGMVATSTSAVAWVPMQNTVSTKSSTDYTILDNDGFGTINVIAGGTDRTITLPTLADNLKRIIRIQKGDDLDSDGTGKCTVTCEGVEAFATGEGAIDLYYLGDHLVLQPNEAGTAWMILNMLQREYCYNTNVTDATSTTGFGYGTGGSQFANFTAARAKRCRFLSAIRATDIIALRHTAFDALTWVLAGQSSVISSFAEQNGSTYGLSIEWVSTTDVDVKNGTYRLNNPSSFGGGGSTWASIDNDATFVWRLEKIRIV